MIAKTRNLVRVADALMEQPDGQHWGYSLSKRSGVRPGVMYPLLSRFLEVGWITDGWEDAAEVGDRPARRYYELTDVGRHELGALASDQRPR